MVQIFPKGSTLISDPPPKEILGKYEYKFSLIIGSGPAGLAAAQQLNRAGHNVTVFERNEEPGGLLRYGIPEFKLEKNIVRRRIDLLEEEGIEFKCSTNVGIDIRSDEIRQALKDPVNAIVEAVKRCLEQTPPELAADILERGIIVAGGGSLLRGIDQIIRERTNVPVNVAEDPLLSVVKGTGMVLENLKKYEAVLL